MCHAVVIPVPYGIKITPNMMLVRLSGVLSTVALTDASSAALGRNQMTKRGVREK